MKKFLKWMALVLLSPIVLVLLLAALLYVPPVQNWAVKRVAAVASEQTGMDISVGHVHLKFPLDLEADDVTVVARGDDAPTAAGDTIAAIGRAIVDVRLWPLLKKEVVVKELQINNANINTQDFISDLQVKGQVGELSLSSPSGNGVGTISLPKEQVDLKDALLKDADLIIMLSDTAAVDTTTTENNWRINFDHIYIVGSRARVSLPGDTMRFVATFGQATATNGDIDLGAPRYALGDLSLTASTISGSWQENGQWQEKHLNISELKTQLTMTGTHLNLPQLVLNTPYSQLSASADVDLNVMDSIAPGTLDLSLDATLGREDLREALADLLPATWPEWPLNVKARLSGNMEQATISYFDIDLPTKFHASAKGNVGNLTDTDRLLAQLDIETEVQRLDFLPADLLPKNINLQQLALSGNVKANGPRYHADLTARQGPAIATVNGWFDTKSMSYDADLSVRQLNLRNYVPQDSLGLLSADVSVRGQGTDFMASSSRLEAEAAIHTLQYGHHAVKDVTANATLSNGHALASVTSDNALLQGTINIDALLTPQPSALNTLSVAADIRRLDLYDLGLTDHPLTVGLCGDFEVVSDFDKRHKLSGLLGDLYIRDTVDTYRPENIGVLLNTNSDTTYLRMQSGDLIVKADATGSYEPLLERLTALSDTIRSQLNSHTIDQPLLKSMLPTMRLYVTSGQENPVANMLRASTGATFQDIKIDLTASAADGLNGTARLLALNTESVRLDTIYLSLKDSSHGLTYQAQVTNNRRNPQFVFNALLDGHLYEHGVRTGVRLFDKDGELGLRLGATAAMEEDGIRFQLMPERPTIGYQEFSLNKDNYVFLRNDQRLLAKVDLVADDGTGVKIYSTEAPSSSPEGEAPPTAPEGEAPPTAPEGASIVLEAEESIVPPSGGEGGASGASDAFIYRLGGNSCLSGDFMGYWQFDHELQVGEEVIFEDMIHYTTVKTTMFNGITHPAIAMLHTDGRLEMLRKFTYEDYRDRMD